MLALLFHLLVTLAATFADEGNVTYEKSLDNFLADVVFLILQDDMAAGGCKPSGIITACEPVSLLTPCIYAHSFVQWIAHDLLSVPQSL